MIIALARERCPNLFYFLLPFSISLGKKEEVTSFSFFLSFCLFIPPVAIKLQRRGTKVCSFFLFFLLPKEMKILKSKIVCVIALFCFLRPFSASFPLFLVSTFPTFFFYKTHFQSPFYFCIFQLFVFLL